MKLTLITVLLFSLLLAVCADSGIVRVTRSTQKTEGIKAFSLSCSAGTNATFKLALPSHPIYREVRVLLHTPPEAKSKDHISMYLSVYVDSDTKQRGTMFTLPSSFARDLELEILFHERRDEGPVGGGIAYHVELDTYMDKE